MKKFLAIMLAVVMTCTLVIGVAASTTPDEENENHKVQAKVETVATGTVYSVDIAWGSLVFTYKDDTLGTWNPSTHDYDNKGTDGWKINETTVAQTVEATVTITNHSNSAVDVKTTYADAEGNDNVTVTVAGASVTAITELPSAEGKATDAQDLQTTFTVSVTGRPDSNVGTTAVDLGTISVTVD